jgi:hypothetical protein
MVKSRIANIHIKDLRGMKKKEPSRTCFGRKDSPNIKALICFPPSK